MDGFGIALLQPKKYCKLYAPSAMKSRILVAKPHKPIIMAGPGPTRGSVKTYAVMQQILATSNEDNVEK